MRQTVVSKGFGLALVPVLMGLLSSPNFADAATRGTKGPRDLVAECKALLEESGSGKSKSASKDFDPVNNPVVIDALEKTAKLVLKNHRVPTQVELSSTLKTSPTNLRSFLALAKVETVSDFVKLAWQAYPSLFERSKDYMLRHAGTFIKNRGRAPKRDELADATGTPVAQLEVVYGQLDNLLTMVRDRRPNDTEKVRNRIIKTFIKIGRSVGRVPTEEEMASELHVTEEQFKEFFGSNRPFKNFEDLVRVAFQGSPGSLKDVVNTELFSEERAERMMEAIKKRKRLVVATAVAGHTVNQEFLDALLKYCQENDAEIIVYPANLQTTGLSEVLLKNPRIHIITNTVQLSDTLALNNIKILAKQLNPLQGLKNMGEVGQSQVIGSPRRHWQTVHTIDNEIRPHTLTTTGALTEPEYHGGKYVQARTDAMASNPRVHFMGALIIEKSNGANLFPHVDGATGEFHMRHVQFIREQKGFMDLNRIYTANGSRQLSPKAVVMGDIHVGSTNQRVLEGLKNQILPLNPEMIILHDLLDGYSISHHDRNKLIGMKFKAQSGKLDLKAELRDMMVFLNSLLALNPSLKLVIMHSNHNHWLSRWLDDGRYIGEPQNLHIGHLLANVAHQGNDPLETIVMHGLSDFDQATGERTYLINPITDPTRVTFVHSGESFKIGGPKPSQKVDMVHGHAGAAGMRGSVRAFANGGNSIMYGHTHTIEVLDGAVNIGTSTERVLPYSKDGLSNWVQGLGLVGPNGERQVLQFKDGEWYTPQGEEVLPPEMFFPEGYPILVPNNTGGTGEGDFDQYGGSGSTAPGNSFRTRR